MERAESDQRKPAPWGAYAALFFVVYAHFAYRVNLWHVLIYKNGWLHLLSEVGSASAGTTLFIIISAEAVVVLFYSMVWRKKRDEVIEARGQAYEARRKTEELESQISTLTTESEKNKAELGALKSPQGRLSMRRRIEQQQRRMANRPRPS